jgi:aromatic ring-cleaving dioxygenase
MTDTDAPYHTHIYYDPEERPRAEAMRASLEEAVQAGTIPNLLFVGRLREGKAGPHPISQFEIHFLKSALPAILPLIEASGLRSLVHPLTDDDLADHTTLGHWIGEPIELDLTTLDPPGLNQGVPRFGKTDF